MSILTLDWFIFLIVLLIIYYLLPAKFQWVLLLVSSVYFFFCKTTWFQQVAYLAFFAVNYFASLLVTPDKSKRKTVFKVAILFDIFYFIILKYPYFMYQIIDSIANVFGASIENTIIRTIVVYAGEICPPHISYFGLIVIGYLCDVYWEKVSVQKNPGKFVLFGGFFPQIISGPIVTYAQMDKELFGEKHRFSYDNTVSALERIIWGAFKKLVVAERCSLIVNTIYSDFETGFETYNGFYIPFAAIMFVAQLYSDFSGLMDIVLGSAQLFGIKLPENFNLPFLSENLSEFWRRWHITLGEWLKNYVLFPIYRSKTFKNLNKWCKKKWGKHYDKKFNLPSYLSLLISWFIIGLWHGGGWNYIFGVGLYMWFIIVMSDILKGVFSWINKAAHINTECLSFKVFRRLRTFVIYAFGLSFFRADTLESGFAMWKAAFYKWNPWIFVDKSLYNLGLDRTEWNICLIGIILMFVVSIIQQMKGSVRETLNRQNFVIRLSVYLVLFLATVVWGYYGLGFNTQSFIYGRF